MGVCSPVDKENNLETEKKNRYFHMNYNTHNCLILKASGKKKASYFSSRNQ